MNIADEIKQLLSGRVVVERYGFEPNRAGFLRCPFHQGDDTASLKVYDEPGRGWHCFGCGKGGSVIDFVMELYGISFRQAVLRLNEDFDLGLVGARPDARKDAATARKRLEAEQELAQYRWAYYLKMVRHRRLLRAYYTRAPQRLGYPIDDEYAEACRDLCTVEYWLETHPWR